MSHLVHIKSLRHAVLMVLLADHHAVFNPESQTTTIIRLILKPVLTTHSKVASDSNPAKHFNVVWYLEPNLPTALL